jgi:hypothetical protein
LFLSFSPAYITAATGQRAKFDSLISQWKLDNPLLAAQISDEALEDIWQRISGNVSTLAPSKRDLASEEAQQRQARQLYRRQNVTSSTVTAARSIVDSAIAQQGKINNQTTSNPRRNKYTKKPSSSTGSTSQGFSNLAPQLTATTPGLEEALPIVAEADAAILNSEGKLHKDYVSLAGKASKYLLPGTPGGSQHQKRSDPNAWFLPNMAVTDTGELPFGNASPIFKNVLYYGAYGDGVHDDTAALNAALNDGCGLGCASTTTKGSVVYLPPGKLFKRPRGNPHS